MTRRIEHIRVLVGRVLAVADRDDCTSADLLDAAQGRRDMLEAALVISLRASSMRPPVLAVVERIESALAEVSNPGAFSEDGWRP